MDAAITFKQKCKHWLVSAADNRFLQTFAHRFTRQHGLIFMLHRFQSTELGSHGHAPDHVERCLAELRRRGFQLVTVDEMMAARQEGRPLPRAVAFTVDDGYLDQAVVGGELFRRYDCPATFFNVTALMDGDYWPDDARIAWLVEHSPLPELVVRDIPELAGLQLPLLDRHARHRSKRQLFSILKRLPSSQTSSLIKQLAVQANVSLPERAPWGFSGMSWDDARRLRASGMQIGSHTEHHVVLSAEPDEVASREISQSRRRLQAEIEQPSEVFCYPIGTRGDFRPEHGQMARDAGYSAALSAEPGYCRLHGHDNDQDPFAIPRFAFPENWDDFLQCILYIELAKDRFRS